MTGSRGWPLRAVTGVGLLAGAWWGLKHPGIQRADVRVGDLLRKAGSGSLDRLVTTTTDLGSVYAVAGAGGVLAASGRQRAAADVVAVGLAAWGLAQGSKTRVQRARPYDADGVRRLIRPPTGSSFPSGHATVAAAVATVLGDRARGTRSRRLLALLGPYVAATRVYVGVHYPSDVIGGVGLGVLLGSLWRGPVAAVGRATVILVAVPLKPVVKTATWLATGWWPRRRRGR